MGLQGSGYYLRNPLLPVDTKSFALNSDGGGYSDTTLVTVIGWGRTSADAYLAAGAARFGLSPLPDPAPEQNLFDRSDNVHFARAGIPTVTFSPGFRSFSDPDIQRHYHTTADVPWTVNFRYLTRFVQAFVHSARLLADSDEPVRWAPGDPYSSIR
jgi:Zn-dependent M28 family amino/carboxypeptidase